MGVWPLGVGWGEIAARSPQRAPSSLNFSPQHTPRSAVAWIFLILFLSISPISMSAPPGLEFLVILVSAVSQFPIHSKH